MREDAIGRARSVHRYAWLWEPLEAEASFVLGSMFGTKVVYLDGRLALCFSARSGIGGEIQFPHRHRKPRLATSQQP